MPSTRKLFGRALALAAAFVFACVAQAVCRAQQTRVASPMPLQNPTASRTHIAFEYAGDIWAVAREGGDARRLTDHPGAESLPLFSPDGSQIAFARLNPASGPLAWDVYVMPAAGGEATRLTYHPDLDATAGWTPDGRGVLFYTLRDRTTFLSARLYTIPAAGGHEEPLPLPAGWDGSFSPDASRIAYTPLVDPLQLFQFRNYRGGAASKIWLARLTDSSVEEIPRADSNELSPVWVGDKVCFLSDRAGAYNLFSYDTRTRAVNQLTRFEKFDAKHAAPAGDDAIVFVRDGAINLYDLRTATTRRVDVRLSGDFPETKPRKVDAWQWAETITPAPDAAHLLVGARGELFTVRVADGEPTNLTRTPAAAERLPAWSPDGRQIAYVSDESGEHELHIRPAAPGGAAARRVSIDKPSSFYAELQWSPDSSRVAFTDARLRLRYYDLASNSVRHVDSSTHTDGGTFMQPAWSPDGRWLAYTKYGVNRVRALMLYSLDSGRTHLVSDPRVDAQQPAFDKSGDYLYYIGSNQTGLVESQGMSGFPFRAGVARTLYAAVLNRETTSPLAPRDEAGGGDDDVTRVRSSVIDPEGVGERVVPLPVGVANPGRLMAGRRDTLFVVEGNVIHRFTAGKPQAEKFVEGAGNYRLTPDGARLFFRRQGRWSVVPTDSASPPKPEDGRFELKPVEVEVDPRAEWRLLYDEAWRRMREYFYDPNLHGQNFDELKAHYAAFLPNVSTREDLNTLFKEMLSHMSVSHMGISGGDQPPTPKSLAGETVGLLGADYETDGGRFRIRRVLRGDAVLGVPGPLARPGLGVKDGDYLLAVDGEELRAGENLYRRFLNKASRAVRIKVAARADGAGARELRVVPVASEYALRQVEWVRANRRRVEELSGGRLAYVYMPNTADDGFNAFNRDFYAQLDRQGLILDARFNEGGRAADYVIDTLRRVPLQRAALRAGDDIRIPTGITEGPVVLLTNESAGSGGDTLPWMAKRTGVAVTLGTRTAGAGVGASTHQLLDGGNVRVPDWGWFDPQTGTWLVENRGFTPDVVLDNRPADWRAGRDPQLERAVQIALEQLRRRRTPAPKRPRHPVYR